MEIQTPVPADGWENYERLFLKDIVVTMYCRIKDPVNKFIIIAKYECGYKEEEIGKMLKISQEAISKRLKKTKEILFRAKKHNAL